MTRGSFSVGMDCPEVEKNSIEVCDESNALKVRTMANDSACLQGWIDRPVVGVKVASDRGVVNYGVATLSEV